MSEAAALYLLEVGQYAKSAVDITRRSQTLLRGLGTTTPLVDLSSAQISRWISKRRGEKAAGKQTFVSSSTVNREITLLRSILRRARDVHEAPVKTIKWADLFLVEPAEREAILSPAQEAALFRELRGDYWPMIRFALVTGQRLSSVIGLTWEQIDWSREVIIFRQKSKRPGGSINIIPMTEEVRAILQTEKARHDEIVFTYQVRRDRPELDMRAGERRPFSAFGWRTHWRRALERAGIADFHFHDLRHCAAMKTLSATGNIKTVQRQLGHADIKTTARYLKSDVEDLRSALEKANKTVKVSDDDGKKKAIS